MACHEIAALRLGLMHVLGCGDEAARRHELAELGARAESPGPLRSLSCAADLRTLHESFGVAAGALEERLSQASTEESAYLRTLVVLVRKVELELRGHAGALEQFFHDLEAMHELTHQLHPISRSQTHHEHHSSPETT